MSELNEYPKCQCGAYAYWKHVAVCPMADKPRSRNAVESDVDSLKNWFIDNAGKFKRFLKW